MKLISFLFTFAAALGFASAAGAGKKATLSEALRGSMEDRAEQRTDRPTLDREEALTKEPSTAPPTFLTKEPSTAPPALDMKVAPAQAEDRKEVPTLPLTPEEERRNRIIELLKESPIGLHGIRDIIADYVDCRLARVPRTQSELEQMNEECFEWGPCPSPSDPTGMRRLATFDDDGVTNFWFNNPLHKYPHPGWMFNYRDFFYRRKHPKLDYIMTKHPKWNCLLIKD